MATVNLGRIKPVFRGAYNNSTSYVVDDIVTSGNETFIAIQAGSGNATSNASYWTKLASKGTDGTDVGSTLTTQGDILYRDGSGLARLGAGTSGQFLKTLGTGANPTWADTGGAVKNVYLFQENNSYTVNNARTRVVTSSSITPVSTSSRFLIQGAIHGMTQGDGGGIAIDVSTDDGANYSVLHEGDASGSRTRSGQGFGFWRGDVDNGIEFNVMGLWYPNTTNACKIAIACLASNTGNLHLNRTHNDSNAYHQSYRGYMPLLITEIDGSATSSTPTRTVV